MDERFSLIAATLDEAKAYHTAQLNGTLFADGYPLPRPVAPPTWRDRVARRWARVTGYLRTVWSALRGDDLVPYNESEW